jgi:hypothetical protein
VVGLVAGRGLVVGLEGDGRGLGRGCWWRACSWQGDGRGLGRRVLGAGMRGLDVGLVILLA